LALTGSAEAIPHARRLLDDDSDEVREIARESLAALEASRNGSRPEQ
jgi:HEAT repeat protein